MSAPKNIIRSLCLAALVLGAVAAPASAAPSFGVELIREEATINRGDEKLTYEVKVKNTAFNEPVVGDTLTCNGIETSTSVPKNWFPGKPGDATFPTFTVEWRRNGVLIPGSSGPAPGSGHTYTTTAADAGKAIQCLVTGKNATAGAKFSSVPALVVAPLPAVGVPNPAVRTAAESRPAITGEESAMRTCVTTAMNWVEDLDGNPATAPTPFTGPFTFQWLRSGDQIAGATASTYTPAVATGTATRSTVSTTLTGVTTSTGTFTVGDVVTGTGIAANTKIVAIDTGAGTITLDTLPASSGTSSITGGADNLKELQCQVTGTNAGGSVIGISVQSNVGTVPNTVNLAPAQNPDVTLGNSTTGPVTLEFEFPAGEDTRFLQRMEIIGVPPAWTCGAGVVPSGGEPAKVFCTSSTMVAPQGSFFPIKLRARLGADAPDPAVSVATVTGGGAPTAVGEDSFTFGPKLPFEVDFFEANSLDEFGNDYTQAGGHPFAAISKFSYTTHLNTVGTPTSDEHLKSITVDAPRGFVGNALAVSKFCPSVEDVNNFPTTCPPESVVGGISINDTEYPNLPIYSLPPERGVPAQFVFGVTGYNLTFSFHARLRPEEGYAVSFESAPVGRSPLIRDIDVTLCNYGAKPLVNGAISGGNQSLFNGCKKASEPGISDFPLVTNPTRCGGGLVARLNTATWEHADDLKSVEFNVPQTTGCEKVPFEPQVSMRPTSKQADSPTGLDVEVTMPTDGIEDHEGISQANLKQVAVTFPEGMGVNASAGQGLDACSADQVKLKTNLPIECPGSSKIGTVEIETPILQETLTGAVYIAKQGDVDGALIGMYLVFESKKDGVLIKLPGRVDPDPVTGQLVATFDESVEAPFSRVAIKFAQGPRATLITPPKCGGYEVEAQMVPWTAQDPDNPTPAETVTRSTAFEVTEGPNGAPCPSGALDPKLSAGVSNPLAGQHTSFNMSLSREDGSQRLTALDLSLPPGLLGTLRGIPYCSEASIQAARDRSRPGDGVAEIDSPSCPDASKVGSVSAGAGAGPNPLYVDTGKAYLAGPYKGAPLSLVVIAPAVAGPLDLGNVVVRSQLRIDRKTAQISAVSDSVPTILQGILLDIRDIRIKMDRPNFILNPTNCEPMSFNGRVSGEQGATASVSDRFKLDGCENLGFKPKLSIHLIGGTRRNDNPALFAKLVTRPGDANIARAAVTLPHSAFLDQAHIRTICTNVQFVADQCPAGAVYGSAEVTTPLLDDPLKGNVILRSSRNKLPNLVADLRGIANIEADGRIDSINGGIRNTFEIIPDAPFSVFTLKMQGGNKKGLVVNSRDLCDSISRATVKMVAQNGRHYDTRPKVIADGCKKKQKQSKKHGGKKRSRAGAVAARVLPSF